MPGLAWRLLSKKTCLCTTAKRDSVYDELPRSLNNSIEHQQIDFYALTRSEKPRRLIRQMNMDESDVEDDITITERLRRASSRSPANIPMLVVVSFNPDAKGLQKNQIEIQRGFPVNAQFIQNEWLYVRTADDEEGFVPYVCCRPMLRRHSLKPSPIDIENSYRPYDFESSKSRPSKSPSTSIPTFTPPINRKLNFQNASGSQSCLLQHSQSCKKRQDVASSSCGGDSGFSDCESSSHHHHQHYRSFDLSLPISTRSSNVRSLRVSSNGSKKNGLLVHDSSSKKSAKNHQNPNIFFKSDASHRTKSQLSISINSAFTQFVKKSANSESEHENSQHQSSNLRSRLFYHRGEVSPTSSSVEPLRRTYKSCDETGDSSSPSTKLSSTVSSPYIRRTPFSRRSLPHHLQPVLKKSLKPILSSSPDPFQTVKKQQLRHIVHAEPSIPPAVIPSKSTIERHFSDLSLNQIENDSLIPTILTRSAIGETRQSFSCSSTSPSTCSSDESSCAFVHIHMNSSRCQLPTQTDSVPFVFSSTNTNNNAIHHNTSTTNSNSFIHNVSITV